MKESSSWITGGRSSRSSESKSAVFAPVEMLGDGRLIKSCRSW